MEKRHMLALRRLAARWTTEAAARKERTPSDPLAEMLASCASDLTTLCGEIDTDIEPLTVQDFARMVRKNESTVRRWILRGELLAARGPGGDWLIPRDAVRTRRERSAA